MEQYNVLTVTDTEAKRRALIIVDVQNDFCARGALAVPDGDAVVPLINNVTSKFADEGSPIFASRDWHPTRTRHFKELGGKWPPHCIQGTKGAQFHPDLRLPKGTVIVSKGMDPGKDAYSAFDGVSEHGEPLIALLERGTVGELWVCGLATEYCVKRTVFDARSRGFDTIVIEDAVRAVNMRPGDGRSAIEEMKSKGALFRSGTDA